MEELYIETRNGKERIDDKIVEKYGLKMGMISPYTRSRILNKYGEFIKEATQEEIPDLSNEDDEIKELENGFMLSQSEMIDIAEGVDADSTSDIS